MQITLPEPILCHFKSSIRQNYNSDDYWSLINTWPAKLASLGLVTSMAISAPLWSNIVRTLPLAPLLPNHLLQNSTNIFSLIVALSSIGIIGLRDFRIPALLLQVSAMTLVLLDLNRLQPWFYEYCLIILLYSFKDTGTDFKTRKLKYVCLILLAIYTFSGLEKLNWNFLTGAGPWLAGISPSPIGHPMTDPVSIAVSLLMCLGEITIALLLALKTTRLFGIGACLLMHYTIVSIIGPQGLNTNAVAWIWNIFQMLLMSGSFLLTTDSAKKLISLDFKYHCKESFIVLCSALLIPVLGLIQIADPFLSFSIYSGDVPRGKLVFNDSTRAKLPAKLSRISHRDKVHASWYLYFSDWGLLETTAPTYPSKLCISLMAKEFATRYKPDNAFVHVLTYPKLSSRQNTLELQLNSNGITKN